MIALADGGSPAVWVAIILAIFLMFALAVARGRRRARFEAEEKVKRSEDEVELENASSDELVDAAHDDGVFDSDVDGTFLGRRPADD